MELHPVVQQIKDLLTENAIAFSYFEHEAVRTSEEAHALRPGYELSQGAKALIIKCKMEGGERKFVQCIIPGDARLDNTSMKNATGAKNISFATKEESDEITSGIEFGGVPPFGNLFGLTVYMDPTLGKHDEILFNCGDRRATIIMQFADYVKLVHPIETSLIQ